MANEIYEPDARETALLNEGRLFRAEADVIIPLLNVKRELAVQKLINNFRSGKTELLLSGAAEISVIEELKTTMENKIKRAELIERKTHGSGN